MLAIRASDFSSSLRLIATTRATLDTSLPALMGESVHRAYWGMVTAQQLSEMEEVVCYHRLLNAERTEIDREEAERFRLTRQVCACVLHVHVIS